MPRKTKRMKQKGAGFSKTRVRIGDSLSACYATSFGNKNIYDRHVRGGVSCEEFVHKYDVQAFPVKDMKGNKLNNQYKLEFNEFFKSPSFKSKVTHRYNDGIDYFYDGKTVKKDRAKWYEEIGSRILWYEFPKGEVNMNRNGTGCYVLRDNPLTIEEVRTNTNEKLNAMLSTLPCITNKMVNRWYRKGERLYNPDYKPPPQPLPQPLPTTNKV